jgi:NAD-dependent dihydropyrimidine dehydrogenase PreA subunit
MAYVICQPCVGVKSAACVEVCPQSAIHPTPSEPDFATASQLYIDPLACIDCAQCWTECPTGAIYQINDVPAQWTQYININANYYR